MARNVLLASLAFPTEFAKQQVVDSLRPLYQYQQYVLLARNKTINVLTELDNALKPQAKVVKVKPIL